MFLSIDFEDFNYDFKVKFSEANDPPLKTDALWKKYNLINEFLCRNGKNNGRFITFFCTAILAEKAPDLIRHISKDGHEIACHYYQHDIMENQSITEVETTLRRAKSILEDASQTEVIGFRAPYFKINKITPEQYLAVERCFDYDSSYYCQSTEELKKFKENMGLTQLKILPVFSKSFAGKNLRLGGTFLKLFPQFYCLFLAQKAREVGITPHIYLHPYEFGVSEEFRVSREELNKLGFGHFKSLYWQYRQSQWLTVRNASTVTKLEKLLKIYQLRGTLRDNMDHIFI